MPDSPACGPPTTCPRPAGPAHRRLEREIAGFGAVGPQRRLGVRRPDRERGTYARETGADAVLRADRETYATVDEVGEAVEREGIDCGFRKGGSLFVATTKPQLAAAARPQHEHDAPRSRRRGRRAGSGRRSRTRSSGSRAAWRRRTPRTAPASHPARLVRGLAEACERLGVTIYERTPVTELGPRRLGTPHGAVRAGVVLQATESYSVQLPGQRLRYLPLYSLMIATEPLPQHVWDEIGWTDGAVVSDMRHLFFYAQRTRDGRIAIGGRGRAYRLSRPIDDENERNAEVRSRLERVIRRHFPAAASAKITHHWGGPLGVPRDWSMAVHFDRASGFGWAGGYAGHGVVAANIAGRTLADLVLGNDTDLVHLPWVGHRSRRWEPEPLRFVASRAIVRILGSADRSEDATGRPARRTRLLAPVLPPH